MTIETFFAFFFATHAICAIPGPTMLLVINYGLHNKGVMKYTLLGVACGDITAILFSFSSIGALLNVAPDFFEIFKIMAAIYIIYLGATEFLAYYNFHKKKEDTKQQVNGFAVFKNLYIITAFNPKTILFFLAFFPQFIEVGKDITLSMIIMFVTFVLTGAFYTLLAHLFARSISGIIKNTNVQRMIHIIVGTILSTIGILTLWH